MANKRIRFYELARELGLSNQEALELCERLRIGVKSHSSSIEDPQADRVRRLADAEGLRRATQPEPEAAPAPAPVRPGGGRGGGPPPPLPWSTVRRRPCRLRPSTVLRSPRRGRRPKLRPRR